MQGNCFRVHNTDYIEVRTKETIFEQREGNHVLIQEQREVTIENLMVQKTHGNPIHGYVAQGNCPSS